MWLGLGGWDGMREAVAVVNRDDDDDDDDDCPDRVTDELRLSSVTRHPLSVKEAETPQVLNRQTETDRAKQASMHARQSASPTATLRSRVPKPQQQSTCLLALAVAAIAHP